MVLALKEKEDLVVDLLNKDYTLRDIAKKAHGSFTDIVKIRKKITGEVTEDDEKEKARAVKSLSITSQSFNLFLEGKSLVDVSIILDISKDEVIHNYCDYLILKNMREVAAILQQYKSNLTVFLKWFNYIKKNNTRVKDIRTAIENINNLKALTQQKEKLKKEVESILEERDYLLKNAGDIKAAYY